MAQFQFRRDARLSMSARLPDMGINGQYENPCKIHDDKKNFLREQTADDGGA